ncbi:MAG: YlxR family protein [Dehalococcoidales bacterium]|nr:YlxR family protein [Dehalococcoidales bacterium]
MTRGNSNRKKTKHAPQRTCVACRNVFDKKELIRLVASEDGTVEPDTTGKKAGRGAYLCRNLDCWTEGCKGTKLERALKIGIDKDTRDRLLDWIQGYLEAKNDNEK